MKAMCHYAVEICIWISTAFILFFLADEKCDFYNTSCIYFDKKYNT